MQIYTVVFSFNYVSGCRLRPDKQKKNSMRKQSISFAQVIKFCKISSPRGGFNTKNHPLRTPLPLNILLYLAASTCDNTNTCIWRLLTDTSYIFQHSLKPLIFSVQYAGKCVSLSRARTSYGWHFSKNLPRGEGRIFLFVVGGINISVAQVSKVFWYCSSCFCLTASLHVFQVSSHGIALLTNLSLARGGSFRRSAALSENCKAKDSAKCGFNYEIWQHNHFQ